jgi:hypothetical protein
METTFMKPPVILLLALLGCGTALANSNFVSNPSLPYPPGCAHPPIAAGPVEAELQTATFFEGTILRPAWQTGEWIELRLKAYRSRCSEPGRSLVWLELTLPAKYAGRAIELSLPWIEAVPPGSWSRFLQLVTEPGGWGSGLQFDRELTLLVSQPLGLEEYRDSSVERRWLFLLDNLSPVSEWGLYFGRGLSAAEYNARFSMKLYSVPQDLKIEVPATAELFPGPSPRLPLSGRHSGTWVIAGAADQGFQLAISEQVGERQDHAPGVPDLPLVLFLSQYTFDSQGGMLWLTGVAEFDPGASEVTVPIVKVSNGQFRGGQAADRETVGSVTLTSNSCNDLTFDYDYSSLGLGTGSRRMQRLFSLETAGYDCRDYDARVEANAY